MENNRKRGQILIESLIVLLMLSSIFILMQAMIDTQREQIKKVRYSKITESRYNESNFETK